MASNDAKPLVEVQSVSKLFGTSQGVTDRLFRREPTPVRAVDDVDLTINEGDIMGIAGESGCGKTTLGKLLVRLHKPTYGTIEFDGEDINDLSNQQDREFRQRVQMIFQDPFESLNPRMTVFQSVMEPLKINEIGEGYQDRRSRVKEVLNDVGLSPAEAYLDEFPSELSGGERQRVAIARALVVDPDFIVCDEPVSMLDVSIRAGVLNMMKELQEDYGLTYLFISHDLSLIRYMCDRTAIMYLGNVIEQGPTDDVVNDPKHPYTEALFDAVPEISPEAERHRANVTGEVPNPRNPPSGCPFHPRCAKIIPPEDWTSSQKAFRRAFQFKDRVLQDDINAEKVVEGAGGDPTDAILERGLALELPEEHTLDGEDPHSIDLASIDLPTGTEQTLRRAAEKLLEDDPAGAKAELEGELETICERSYPEMRETGSRITACHLYEHEESEPAVTPPSH